MNERATEKIRTTVDLSVKNILDDIYTRTPEKRDSILLPVSKNREDYVRHMTDTIVYLIEKILKDESEQSIERRIAYSGMNVGSGNRFFMNFAKNGKTPPKYRFSDLYQAEIEQVRLANETGDEITLMMSLTTVKSNKVLTVVANNKQEDDSELPF